MIKFLIICDNPYISKKLIFCQHVAEAYVRLTGAGIAIRWRIVFCAHYARGAVSLRRVHKSTFIHCFTEPKKCLIPFKTVHDSNYLHCN